MRRLCGCGARSCVDCAQVEYEKVQFDGDDNCDSVGGVASVPVRSMPPVRTGLGEALLLLYATPCYIFLFYYPVILVTNLLTRVR